MNENSLQILGFVVHQGGTVPSPSWAVEWNVKQAWAFEGSLCSKDSVSVFHFSTNGSLHLSGKIVGAVSGDTSILFPYFDFSAVEFNFEDSPVDCDSRNWICLRIFSTFYHNMTNSPILDFTAYLRKMVRVFDSEDKYNLATGCIINLIRQGDRQAVLSKPGDPDPFVIELNNTALFMTSKGQFGISRRDVVQNGDKIAFLSGFDKPVILRETEAGYQLISTSIVSGVMDGELWSDDPNGLEEIRMMQD